MPENNDSPKQEPVPPWMGAGAYTFPSLHKTNPWQKMAPEKYFVDPAWQALTQGMVYQNSQDDNNMNIVKKSPAKTKKTDKSWDERLDEYPKDQSETTPPLKRFCVVSLEDGIDVSSQGDQWLWRKPYWVRGVYSRHFEMIMALAYDIGNYMHKDLCGMYSNTWYTVEYLKNKGFVLLSYVAYSGKEWHPKAQTIEFWTNREKDVVQLAKMSDRTSFPLCSLANKRFHSSEFCTIQTSNGSLMTASATGINQQKNLKICPNCGAFTHIDWMTEIGAPTNSIVCNKCHTVLLEKSVVRDYNDSNFLPPIPDFKNTVRGKETIRVQERRMFGVEVEIGMKTGDRVKVALDTWNTIGRDFCYIKHDGSITKKEFEDGYKVKNPMEIGFEVVSAPAGINVHREKWKKIQECKFFKSFRAWDADSCGFHVHVSRNALTAIQIGRILVFMNHINNRYFVEVVAGRTAGFYTRFVDKKLTDLDKMDKSKYMAVRTNKKDSIEFRIFRGTVNYRHIIRNIEFCDAVCDFCAPCVSSVKDLSDFRTFIAFVNERKGFWPILEEWLGCMHMIAKKKIPQDNKHFKAMPIEEAVDEKVSEQLKNLMTVIGSKESIEVALGKCKGAQTELGIKTAKKANPLFHPEPDPDEEP